MLGATCFGGQRPVDGFLSAVYSAKNPTSTVAAPTSINAPRLENTLFAQISTDGKTWTQQNFVCLMYTSSLWSRKLTRLLQIDAWYGTLSSVGGPFPPNTDLVVSYFNRILEWTAFCPGTGIPFQNIRDYVCPFAFPDSEPRLIPNPVPVFGYRSGRYRAVLNG